MSEPWQPSTAVQALAEAMDAALTAQATAARSELAPWIEDDGTATAAAAMAVLKGNGWQVVPLATHPFLVDLESEEAVKELATAMHQIDFQRHPVGWWSPEPCLEHTKQAESALAAWRSLRDAR